MKYYLLKNSIEDDVVGKEYHRQCKGVPDGYTFDWYDEPNSMTKLTNEEFPKEKPDLVFELFEDATLTDIVSASNLPPMGFLVNQKAKDLLEEFNLIAHKFYPATLFANKQMHEYYWFHPVKDNFIGLDFKKSDFIEVDLFNDKIRDVNVNSLKDYNIYWEESRKDVNFIKTEKLVLKEEYKKLDVFFFPLIHQDLIVSEKTIESIQNNDITGFTYKETDFIS